MSKRCILFGHKFVELLAIEASEGLTHTYSECARCPSAQMQTRVILTEEVKQAGKALLDQLSGA